MGPGTAVARARVSGVRAVLSAADRDSVVGVGPSCAAPMPRSATRPAQYGWFTPGPALAAGWASASHGDEEWADVLIHPDVLDAALARSWLAPSPGRLRAAGG